MTFPMKDAQEFVEFRGVYVDKITRAFFLAMEEELGYPLTVLQGGNRPRTTYSGTTHTEGGVGDLAAFDWERKCEVAIKLGGYPYHRPYAPGLWGEHVHVGIIDHPNRDAALRQQQEDWLHNPVLDGLVGTNVYRDGPTSHGRKIVFNYDPKTEQQVEPMTPAQQAKDKLVHAISDIGDAAAIMDKTPVARAQVKHLKDVHADLRDVLKVLNTKI